MRRELFAAFLLPLASAQTLIAPAAARAVLARASRNRASQALTCQVAAIKPVLNFGLRLQAGYIFRLPMSQYSGPGHNLTVLTTITPESAAQPVYLIDRLRLPPVPRTDADGEASGGFFLGEGRYHVNWLLFDDAGRACSRKWEVDAQLARADRDVKLVMPPGTVTDVALRVSSTAGRRPGAAASKRLTVLLDAAPLSAAPFTAGILRSSDQVLLLGTMSALLEHVPASSVRLVVFNLEQQKELFRRDGFAPESLNEVAQTLNQLQLAKVDYQTLLNRTGHIDLLAALINRELRAEPRSDIVVFLGPRERFHDNFPDGVLDKRRGSAPRFFFLAYQVPVPLEGIAHSGERDVSFGGIEVSDNPRDERALRRSSDIIVTTPPEGLPDTLSKAIGKVKGKTMTIESPRQFAKAIKEIVGRAGR